MSMPLRFFKVFFKDESKSPNTRNIDDLKDIFKQLIKDESELNQHVEELRTILEVGISKKEGFLFAHFKKFIGTNPVGITFPSSDILLYDDEKDTIYIFVRGKNITAKNRHNITENFDVRSIMKLFNDNEIVTYTQGHPPTM